MAIQTKITNINLTDDYLEVEMFVYDGEDVRYNHARIVIFVENRDWTLSEIKAEATRKAKAFLSQVVSSLPD